MAEKQKRGWVWSDREKEWFEELRTFRPTKKYQSVIQQAQLFEKLIPRFSKQARALASKYETTYERSKAITSGRKRKFQELSPDEAAKMLAELNEKWAGWNAFLGRSDVQQAISKANREANRKKNEAKKGIERVLRSTLFAEKVRDNVDSIIRETDANANLLQDFAKSKKKPSADEIARLHQIEILRTWYFFNRKRTALITSLVTGVPRPPIRQLITFMVSEVLKEEVEDYEKTPPFARGRLKSIIEASAHAVINTLLDVNGLHSKVKPLKKNWFEICGVDYSIEAQPD